MPDLSNIFQQSVLYRRQMTLNRCVELFGVLHVCVAACARTVAALCVCVSPGVSERGTCPMHRRRSIGEQLYGQWCVTAMCLLRCSLVLEVIA